MRVTVKGAEFSLEGISAKQISVIMFLLGHIKDRCFLEAPQNGQVFSGEGFSAAITPEELELLKNFVSEFWSQLNKK